MSPREGKAAIAQKHMAARAEVVRRANAYQKLVEALRKQTAYIAAVDGVLRTLPVPSEHAFEGARRYSEVLSSTKAGIAESCAVARALLHELGEA